MMRIPRSFDSTVPESAKEEMRGRGPAEGCDHTLKEIGEIMCQKGLSERPLKPFEVKRLLDATLDKVNRKITPILKDFVDDTEG